MFFCAATWFNRLRIDQIYEIIGIDLLTHSSNPNKDDGEGHSSQY